MVKHPRATNLLAPPAPAQQPVGTVIVEKLRGLTGAELLRARRRDMVEAEARRLWIMHDAMKVGPVNAAIELAERTTGEKWHELFVTTIYPIHLRGQWARRRWAFWAAMRTTGISYPEIAAATGTCHAAVIAALQRLGQESTVP